MKPPRIPLETIAEEMDARVEQLKGMPDSQRLWLELYVLCKCAAPQLKDATRKRWGTRVQGEISDRYKLVEKIDLFSREFTLTRLEAFYPDDNVASILILDMTKIWKGIHTGIGYRDVKGYPGNDPRNFYVWFE